MSNLFNISVLGFTPFEHSAISAVLRLAAKRLPPHQLVDDLTTADLVLVDADNRAVVRFFLKVRRQQKAILIGEHDHGTGMRLCHRPVRALDILGAILAEIAPTVPTVAIVPTPLSANVPASFPASFPASATTAVPADASARALSTAPAEALAHRIAPLQIMPVRAQDVPVAGLATFEVTTPAMPAPQSALVETLSQNVSARTSGQTPAPRVAFTLPSRLSSAPAPAPRQTAVPLATVAVDAAPTLYVVASASAALSAPAPDTKPAAKSVPNPSAQPLLSPQPSVIIAVEMGAEPALRQLPELADPALTKPAPTEPAPTEPAPQAYASLPSTAVLIVDDSPVAILALQARLARRGVACIAASSGEEALSLLGENAVQLVLLDVQMKGMDGYQTCRAIKRGRYGARKCPTVVMLTSRSGAVDKIRGTLAGSDGYQTKPLSDTALMEVLDKHGILPRAEWSRAMTIQTEPQDLDNATVFSAPDKIAREANKWREFAA